MVLHGHVKDAKAMLQKIATVNGKPFPEDTFHRFVGRLHAERSRIQGSFTDNEDASTNADAQRDNSSGKDEDPTSEDLRNFKDENIIVLIRHRRLAIRVVIVFWNW